MGAAVRDSPMDAFASLDADGDGYAEYDEFTEAAERMSPPLSSAQAQDVFSKLDTDGDTKVSASEFLTAYAASQYLPAVPRPGPPLTINAYRQCFQQGPPGTSLAMVKAADTNHDGALDQGEFTQAVSACSPALTAAQAEYAFKGLDVDEDGWVDAKEFEAQGLSDFFEPRHLEAVSS